MTIAVSDITHPHIEGAQAELESGARGKAFRERRDIVSGNVMEEADLIRMAIGPDNVVVPDVAAKLPGRGMWIAANRVSVDIAIAKGLFSRSAKTKLTADKGLADLTEHVLRRRVLGLLGMALRSGQLEMGYDKVRGMIAGEPPAWRIAANDAARDGRNKIRMASKAAWNATPLLACFSSIELGGALGREDVTHAALREGPLAETFEAEVLRLAGFTALTPEDWQAEINDLALWHAARNGEPSEYDQSDDDDDDDEFDNDGVS